MMIRAGLVLVLVLALAGCGRLKRDEPIGRSRKTVDLSKVDLEKGEVTPRQLDEIKRQVKRGERVQDPDQVSNLLFMAALAGNEGLIKALLQNGADIHARDRTDATAIHKAVFDGNVNAVKLLLRNGADVNDKCEGRPLLYDAVADEPMVKLLLERGANPNAREDVYGFSPLHGAVVDQKIGVVRLLIGANAEVDAKNKLGVAPLHLAAQLGNLEITKALLEAGADPNIRTQAGVTPNKAATQAGKMDTADLVKEWGGGM